MTKFNCIENPQQRCVEDVYAAYVSGRGLATANQMFTESVPDGACPRGLHSHSPDDMGGEKGPDNHRVSIKPYDLTARQQRVLRALYLDYLHHRQGISRERLDDIAGASNSPQIVSELRRRLLGNEGLLCRKVDVVDRDGKTCKAGRYFLSDEGFALVRKLQEGRYVE